MAEQYIKIGWESYRKLVLPDNATETQLVETRQAFFSGASVLFEIITRQLDPKKEVTEKDLQFMTEISNETAAFGQELDRKLLGLTTH